MEKEQIYDAASNLNHAWIITDALADDDQPDVALYMATIHKIKSIEDKYTASEIFDGNLLCDIW